MKTRLMTGVTFTSLRQVIAIITLFTFFISNQLSAVAIAQIETTPHESDSAVSLSNNSLNLPQNLGSVQKICLSDKDQMVILLQDAHAVPDAQRNIEKIISYYKKNLGVHLIALEGASGRLEPQILRSFPAKKTLRKIVNQYYRNGEITGPVAAAIFDSGSADFRGVENWDLYEDGLRRYIRAMNAESKVAGKVDELKRRLLEEKTRIYSGKLLRIDEALDSFDRDQTNFADILNLLSKIQRPARGSQLALIATQTRKDNRENSSVRLELKAATDAVKKVLLSKTPENSRVMRAFNQKCQLYQTSQISDATFAVYLEEVAARFRVNTDQSKSLKRLMRDEKRMRDIKGTALFREFEVYAESVKKTCIRNRAERRLDQSSHQLRLVEKLARLALSHAEWTEIKALRIENSGLRKETDIDSLNPVSLLFNPGMQYAMKFYENTEQRDRVLFENLMKLMCESKSKIKASKDRSQEVVLMIAGGFHTEGIARRLKAKGISYAIVTPRMDSVPNETNYRAGMRGEVSWEKYFFVENGKIHLYDAFVRGMRDQLLRGGRSHMLKNWRDQLIRDLSECGKITQASRHTRYLDEFSKASDADEFTRAWLKNIKRFMQGMSKLDQNGQLTGDNIKNLMRLATIPALAVNAENAVPDSAGLDAKLFDRSTLKTKRKNKPELGQPNFRSETRKSRSELVKESRKKSAFKLVIGNLLIGLYVTVFYVGLRWVTKGYGSFGEGAISFINIFAIASLAFWLLHNFYEILKFVARYFVTVKLAIVTSLGFAGLKWYYHASWLTGTYQSFDDLAKDLLIVAGVVVGGFYVLFKILQSYYKAKNRVRKTREAGARGNVHGRGAIEKAMSSVGRGIQSLMSYFKRNVSAVTEIPGAIDQGMEDAVSEAARPRRSQMGGEIGESARELGTGIRDLFGFFRKNITSITQMPDAFEEGLNGEAEKQGEGPRMQRKSEASPQRSETRIGFDLEENGWDDAWTEAVRTGWEDGVDFDRIFGDARLLVIGDTNHGFIGIQKGFIELIRGLKAAGVTHLAIEISSDEDLNNLSEIAQRTWVPHRLKQLVRTAQELGIRIVFMDMPKEEQKKIKSESDQSHKRSVYMGNFLATFLRGNPTAKVAAITGFAHIKEYGEIPQELERNRVAYHMVGAVSEGQFGHLLGMMHPLLVLPIVTAVQQVVEPEHRYGFIRLPLKQYYIDGVIHFARPRMDSKEAKTLPLLLGLEKQKIGTELTVKNWIGGLRPIQEGQVTIPIYRHFKEEVSGDAIEWPETNEIKIIRFVLEMENLSLGQKFYLAALLASYARNMGRHSLNGSIVEIGFVPDGQFFEITTVDTALSKYDPSVDYGSFQHHWEISLKTLQQHFGFEDILHSLRDIPEVQIRNNPDRPLSLLKIPLLVMTALTHPERIAIVGSMFGSDLKLRVFYSDVSHASGASGGIKSLTEAEVEDFELDVTESRLRAMTESIYELREDSSTLVYGTDAMYEQLQKLPKIAFMKRSRVNEAFKKMRAFHDATFGSDSFIYQLKIAILEARQHLRYLNEGQLTKLLKLLDQIIESGSEAVQTTKALFDRYPDLKMNKVRNAPLEGMNYNQVLSAAEAHLEAIKRIRHSIHHETLPASAESKLAIDHESPNAEKGSRSEMRQDDDDYSPEWRFTQGDVTRKEARKLASRLHFPRKPVRVLLLVENDAGILTFYQKRIFTEEVLSSGLLARVHFEYAINREEAQHYLQEHQDEVGLIITDRHMPEIIGDQVHLVANSGERLIAYDVRGIGNTVPIVIVSAEEPIIDDVLESWGNVIQVPKYRVFNEPKLLRYLVEELVAKSYRAEARLMRQLNPEELAFLIDSIFDGSQYDLDERQYDSAIRIIRDIFLTTNAVARMNEMHALHRQGFLDFLRNHLDEVATEDAALAEMIDDLLARSAQRSEARKGPEERRVQKVVWHSELLKSEAEFVVREGLKRQRSGYQVFDSFLIRRLWERLKAQTTQEEFGEILETLHRLYGDVNPDSAPYDGKPYLKLLVCAARLPTGDLILSSPAEDRPESLFDLNRRDALKWMSAIFNAVSFAGSHGLGEFAPAMAREAGDQHFLAQKLPVIVQGVKRYLTMAYDPQGNLARTIKNQRLDQMSHVKLPSYAWLTADQTQMNSDKITVYRRLLVYLMSKVEEDLRRLVQSHPRETRAIWNDTVDLVTRYPDMYGLRYNTLEGKSDFTFPIRLLTVSDLDAPPGWKPVLLPLYREWGVAAQKLKRMMLALSAEAARELIDRPMAQTSDFDQIARDIQRQIRNCKVNLLRIDTIEKRLWQQEMPYISPAERKVLDMRESYVQKMDELEKALRSVKDLQRVFGLEKEESTILPPPDYGSGIARSEIREHPLIQKIIQYREAIEEASYDGDDLEVLGLDDLTPDKFGNVPQPEVGKEKRKLAFRFRGFPRATIVFLERYAEARKALEKYAGQKSTRGLEIEGLAVHDYGKSLRIVPHQFIDDHILICARGMRHPWTSADSFDVLGNLMMHGFVVWRLGANDIQFMRTSSGSEYPVLAEFGYLDHVNSLPSKRMAVFARIALFIFGFALRTISVGIRLWKQIRKLWTDETMPAPQETRKPAELTEAQEKSAAQGSPEINPEEEIRKLLTQNGFPELHAEDYQAIRLSAQKEAMLRFYQKVFGITLPDESVRELARQIRSISKTPPQPAELKQAWDRLINYTPPRPYRSDPDLDFMMIPIDNGTRKWLVNRLRLAWVAYRKTNPKDRYWLDLFKRVVAKPEFDSEQNRVLKEIGKKLGYAIYGDEGRSMDSILIRPYDLRGVLFKEAYIVGDYFRTLAKEFLLSTGLTAYEKGPFSEQVNAEVYLSSTESIADFVVVAAHEMMHTLQETRKYDRKDVGPKDWFPEAAAILTFHWLKADGVLSDIDTPSLGLGPSAVDWLFRRGMELWNHDDQLFVELAELESLGSSAFYAQGLMIGGAALEVGRRANPGNPYRAALEFTVYLEKKISGVSINNLMSYFKSYAKMFIASYNQTPPQNLRKESTTETPKTSRSEERAEIEKMARQVVEKAEGSSMRRHIFDGLYENEEKLNVFLNRMWTRRFGYDFVYENENLSNRSLMQFINGDRERLITVMVEGAMTGIQMRRTLDALTEKMHKKFETNRRIARISLQFHSPSERLIQDMGAVEARALVHGMRTLRTGVGQDSHDRESVELNDIQLAGYAGAQHIPLSELYAKLFNDDGLANVLEVNLAIALKDQEYLEEQLRVLPVTLAHEMGHALFDSIRSKIPIGGMLWGNLIKPMQNGSLEHPYFSHLEFNFKPFGYDEHNEESVSWLTMPLREVHGWWVAGQLMAGEDHEAFIHGLDVLAGICLDMFYISKQSERRRISHEDRLLLAMRAANIEAVARTFALDRTENMRELDRVAREEISMEDFYQKLLGDVAVSQSQISGRPSSQLPLSLVAFARGLSWNQPGSMTRSEARQIGNLESPITPGERALAVKKLVFLLRPVNMKTERSSAVLNRIAPDDLDAIRRTYREDKKELEHEILSKVYDLRSQAVRDVTNRLDEHVQPVEKAFAIGVVFPVTTHEAFLHGFLKGLHRDSVREFLADGRRLPEQFVDGLKKMRIIPRFVDISRRSVLSGEEQIWVPLALMNSKQTIPLNPMFLPLVLDLEAGQKLTQDPDAMNWFGKLTSRALIHIADLSEKYRGNPVMLKAELLRRLNLEGYDQMITMVQKGNSLEFGMNARMAQIVFEELVQKQIQAAA